uniref:hypothetical protein n=1 Tax=Hyalangium versicolor TaxID=2861190 RepID=UPI001CCB3FE5
GRLAQPCIIRVPKGAVAVVSLYAVVTSPSVSDPVVGWPSMAGLKFEAELTTSEDLQPRILQVAEQGRIPVCLGPTTPTARVLVPAATWLKWWAYAEDPVAIATAATDANVILWARALLVDEATSYQDLSKLMAGGL